MKQRLRRKQRKMPVVVEAGIPIRNIGRGKLQWQVDFARGLKRERKCFPDEDAARAYARKLAGKFRFEGLDALSLSAEERGDAKRALDLLQGRAKLVDAARAFLKLHPDTGAETVGRAMVRYLRAMRDNGRRPLSLKDKRWKFAKMLPHFRKRPVSSVAESDFEAWATGQGYTGTTRDNYMRAARNLLNFVAGKTRAKRRERREVKTWPTATVQGWLRAAETLTPDAMPTWALLFFCGLRPYEAARLSWEAIDLAHKHVRVDGAISKVGESRLVKLPDNALAWLAAYRPVTAKGPMVPGENPMSTVRRWRDAVKRKLNIETYPVDVTRHTFATAHFEAYGDAGATAKELGHFGNLDTFRRHYKGLMPHSDALAYWQIKPAAKRILQFQRASA